MTGRIIVDAFGFGKFNPDHPIPVTAIKPEDGDEPRGTATRRTSFIDDSEQRRPSPEEQQSNKNEIQARRQLLLLMSPMLAGYSLKLKRWREYPGAWSWRVAKKQLQSGCLLKKYGHCLGMKTLMTISSFQKTRKVFFYHLSRIISSQEKRLMLLREKVNLIRHWPPIYLFNITVPRPRAHRTLE